MVHSMCLKSQVTHRPPPQVRLPVRVGSHLQVPVQLLLRTSHRSPAHCLRYWVRLSFDMRYMKEYKRDSTKIKCQLSTLGSESFATRIFLRQWKMYLFI